MHKYVYLGTDLSPPTASEQKFEGRLHHWLRLDAADGGWGGAGKLFRINETAHVRNINSGVTVNNIEFINPNLKQLKGDIK